MAETKGVGGARARRGEEGAAAGGAKGKGSERDQRRLEDRVLFLMKPGGAQGAGLGEGME